MAGARPDEIDLAALMHWRQGRRVGRTIYAQAGDEPSDQDTLIGVMDSPSLAAAAVTAHNHHLPDSAQDSAHCTRCGLHLKWSPKAKAWVHWPTSPETPHAGIPA